MICGCLLNRQELLLSAGTSGQKIICSTNLTGQVLLVMTGAPPVLNLNWSLLLVLYTKQDFRTGSKLIVRTFVFK